MTNIEKLDRLFELIALHKDCDGLFSELRDELARLEEYRGIAEVIRNSADDVTYDGKELKSYFSLCEAARHRTLPVIRQFEGKEAMEPYIVRYRFTAGANDVALSAIYHQMDDKIALLEEGEEYDREIKPYGYFEYKDKIWPVYDDDAGQQDMIYLNGEFRGAGAYNFNPLEQFIDMIDSEDK